MRLKKKTVTVTIITTLAVPKRGRRKKTRKGLYLESEELAVEFHCGSSSDFPLAAETVIITLPFLLPNYPTLPPPSSHTDAPATKAPAVSTRRRMQFQRESFAAIWGARDLSPIIIIIIFPAN